MQSPIVDVLIPLPGSPLSLCPTLAALAGQRYPAFRVTAARPEDESKPAPQLEALTAVLEARGHPVRFVAMPATLTDGQRRQAMLEHAEARYALFVDDGVFVEPDLIGRLVAAIRSSGSAFVGSSVVDLRFRDDHRPDDEAIEFWDGPVRPEDVAVGQHAWERRRLHRGANLQHLRERLPRTRDRLYRIADISGCVLYDVEKLRSAGGFLPTRDHGHDPRIPARLESAAQLRLLARHGGAGLFPSGAYRLVPSEDALTADGLGRDRADHRRGRERRRVSVRSTRLPRRPSGHRHGVASRFRRPLAPR